MSREIKFRAYDKEAKEYYYDAEYTYDFQCSGRGCYADSFGEVLAQPERYVVEQYTGLKDKNGKEIYEGDIVEFGIAGAENRGVVGYEEDFGSYETYTSKGYIIAPLFTSRGKIIGNIHENPESLKSWNAAELEGNR